MSKKLPTRPRGILLRILLMCKKIKFHKKNHSNSGDLLLFIFDEVILAGDCQIVNIIGYFISERDTICSIIPRKMEVRFLMRKACFFKEFRCRSAKVMRRPHTLAPSHLIIRILLRMKLNNSPFTITAPVPGKTIYSFSFKGLPSAS